jgi:hypothetical protein
MLRVSSSRIRIAESCERRFKLSELNCEPGGGRPTQYCVLECSCSSSTVVALRRYCVLLSSRSANGTACYTGDVIDILPTPDARVDSKRTHGCRARAMLERSALQHMSKNVASFGPGQRFAHTVPPVSPHFGTFYFQPHVPPNANRALKVNSKADRPFVGLGLSVVWTGR